MENQTQEEIPINESNTDNVIPFNEQPSPYVDIRQATIDLLKKHNATFVEEFVNNIPDHFIKDRSMEIQSRAVTTFFIKKLNQIDQTISIRSELAQQQRDPEVWVELLDSVVIPILTGKVNVERILNHGEKGRSTNLHSGTDQETGT